MAKYLLRLLVFNQFSKVFFIYISVQVVIYQLMNEA